MTITFNPYLNFRGNARQAMEFYQKVFGGELNIGTFRDYERTDVPAEVQDQVMHARLTAPNGINIMASDIPANEDLTIGDNITLSLTGDDDATLRGWYEQLSKSGHATQPLIQASWGDTFGMCVDGFGIMWLFDIAGAQE